MRMSRLPPEEYYIQIAKATALRSTCERAKVGCILVKDSIILGTGYNGSLPGEPHCDEQKTCTFKGNCIRTIHAELNAIQRAIKAGHNIEKAVAYSTHSPCYSCMKTFAAFGISHIYYENTYDDERAIAYSQLTNMSLIQIKLGER
jgi:dCMP deaminase